MKHIDAHILEAVQNAARCGLPHSYLLQIEVGGEPIKDIFLTSRELTIVGIDIEVYNYVLEWGDITEHLEFSARTSALGDMTIKLTGKFWQLDAQFDLHNKDAKIYKIYGDDVYLPYGWGGPWGDEWGYLGNQQGNIAAELIFWGAIRQIQGNPYEVELTIEDFTSRFNQPFPDEVIIKDSVLWSCPKDAIGQGWPYVFGEIGLANGGLWAPPKVFERPQAILADTLDATTDSYIAVALETDLLEGDIIGLYPGVGGCYATLNGVLNENALYIEATITSGAPPGRGYFRIDNEFIYTGKITALGAGVYAFDELQRGLYFSCPTQHPAGLAFSLCMFAKIGEELVVFHYFDTATHSLGHVNRGLSLGTAMMAHEPGETVTLELCPEYWAITNAEGRSPDSATINAAYALLSNGYLSQLDANDYDYGPTTTDLRKNILVTKQPPRIGFPSRSKTQRIMLNFANQGGHNAADDQDIDTFFQYSILAGADLDVIKYRLCGYRDYGAIKAVYLKVKYWKDDYITASASYYLTNILTQGAGHPLDNTGLSDVGDQVAAIAEIDITNEFGKTPASWDWLSDFIGEIRFALTNTEAALDGVFQLYEAWLEVEYYHDDDWTLLLDIDGLKETSLDGTYKLLTNPADVAWYIGKKIIDERYLDRDSFETALSMLTQQPIVFNFAVSERQNLMAYLEELAWQCHCIFLWEVGRLRMVPMFSLATVSPSEEDSVVYFFDNSSISDKRYHWTPLETLINDIRLYWQKQYAQNSDALRLPTGQLTLAAQTKTSAGDGELADSQARYRQKMSLELDCYAIRTLASIENLYGFLRAGFYLKRGITFRTDLRALPLERYDIIALTDSDWPSADGLGCTDKLLYVYEVKKMGVYEIEVMGYEV